MRRRGFTVFILLIIFVLSACGGAEEENKKEEDLITSVETEAVKKGDFTIEKKLYGSISPSIQHPVLLSAPGEVTTLKVKNGDKVQKDDHLATVKTEMGSQTIYASKAGEIAHLRVEEGAFQSNEEPLLVIADLDTLLLSFSVTPSTRDQFKKEDTIHVQIDDKKYEATIQSVDTLPNETGQFIVEAELDNEKRAITPGAVGQIVVTEERVKDTLIVPTEAILTEGNESFLFVVRGDIVEQVVVDITNTQSKETAIKGDLKKGDQVVVNGQFTLTDGSKVEVMKEGKAS